MPERKKIRVIIDTDCKNEADDQYALAHALMTPKFRIAGIVAAHFGASACSDSMRRSYDEILKVMELMGMEGAAPVFEGAEAAIPSESAPRRSSGSDFIIREALRDDPAPLYALFWGPLTDMASALLLRPEIAGKLTVVWVGGAAYPQGGGEFNLGNDIHAANVVMKSEAAVQIVTLPAFSRIFAGFAELQRRVSGRGRIGEYLYRQLLEYADSRADTTPPTMGEGWCLGDTASLGLILNPHHYAREVHPAPLFTHDMQYITDTGCRDIEIFQNVDARFLLEDFYCKLDLCYPAGKA
jgi:inosine-uridine nucleoside N-ribohydrolase